MTKTGPVVAAAGDDGGHVSIVGYLSAEGELGNRPMSISLLLRGLRDPLASLHSCRTGCATDYSEIFVAGQ